MPAKVSDTFRERVKPSLIAHLHLWLVAQCKAFDLIPVLLRHLGPLNKVLIRVNRSILFSLFRHDKDR